MIYFAYGSNMLLARLQRRVPSARRIDGVFCLPGHQLRFHKEGMDGSAKCDSHLTDDPADRVLGALFEMDPAHRDRLDAAEGLGDGYLDKDVQVSDTAGRLVEAHTYYATRINGSLLPFSWYKDHVLMGARETDLPRRYIASIEKLKSTDDDDWMREVSERAIQDQRIHLRYAAE